MRSGLLFCLSILFLSCAMTPIEKDKVNGLSFVASREPIDESHVLPMVEVHANHAAIMPFGFIRNLDHPELVYNTERQWFGETLDGVKQYVAQLRKHDVKLMLKPQIWVWRGEYTGHIKMENEENWELLESTYSDYILSYAKLADELDIELFCIGTELEQFVANRPEFWSRLITEVKQVYRGKLTYAANWDEFKRTPFWQELDYIGVDAYFPVCDKQTPSVEECRSGWQPHKTLLKEYAVKYEKPILFTEFGYRSVDFAGKEPWRSDREMDQINLQAQVNTLQALFEEFWRESWFAGGFLWKWYHNHQRAGGIDNSRFTPQNKPVEAVIKIYFSN